MRKLLKVIIVEITLMPVFAFSQTSRNFISVGYSSICYGTPSEKPVMDFIKILKKRIS